jgi:hypothetical protein
MNNKSISRILWKRKASTIANLFEEEKEEDPIVNKIGVNHFRHPVINPPFFMSVKIMDKIAHCCLIDGSFGLKRNVKNHHGRARIIMY